MLNEQGTNTTALIPDLIYQYMFSKQVTISATVIPNFSIKYLCSTS